MSSGEGDRRLWGFKTCAPPANPDFSRRELSFDTPQALQREFHFKDFSAAINFVNRLAEVAETASHHPDISIHWNRVVVRWWTQAAQAITDRDAELAGQTDGLAKG